MKCDCRGRPSWEMEHTTAPVLHPARARPSVSSIATEPITVNSKGDGKAARGTRRKMCDPRSKVKVWSVGVHEIEVAVS
ncbi:hypothetical protein J6590_048934 [Homalodisca vitripennis]|nr:hypothetical protein J6590_048934 [Homalodisca vitripennis]